MSTCNSAPFFSIIMPAYNARAYIREAVNSVVNQTYKDWELIIVDDGSKDDTAQIIESEYHEDSRIILVRQEHKGTAGAARNTAIGIAKGKYIQLLDSDDYLSPGCLESYVEAFENNPEKPNLIVPVACAVDDWGNVSMRWDAPATGNRLTGLEAFELSIRWKIHGWICAESTLLKRIRFEENLINGDELTVRKLYYNSRKIFFTDGIYYYRLNQNSTTHSSRNFVRMFDYQITAHHLYDYSKSNRMPLRIRKECANYFRDAVISSAYSYSIHREPLSDSDEAYVKQLLSDGCRKIEPVMIGFSKFGLLAFTCFRNSGLLLREIMLYGKLKEIFFNVFGNRTVKAIRKEERRCQKNIRKSYRKKGARAKNKTAIIMFDGRIAAGGLCDRLRGVVSIYQSCKKKNIDFKLNFCSPFQLADFMEPNQYNWIIDEKDIRYDRESLPIFIDSRKGTQVEAEKQRKLVEKVLGKNYSQFHFYTNAHYSLFSDSYSKDFRELFRPSERLQKELKVYQGRLKQDGYVSVSFRFMQLLGDFNERYTDFYTVLSDSQKQLYIQKSLRFLNDLHDKERKTVFVATDSRIFMEEADKLPFVFTVPGEIHHVDVSCDDSINAHKKTFIDFYLISNADRIYLGHTGMMHYSGFPKGAALLSGKKLEVVEY